jgi:signal transduction histidine kinase
MTVRGDRASDSALAYAAVILGSSALVWAQPRSPAVAGVFVAVGVAAMGAAPRRSLSVLGIALLAFVVAAAHAGRSPGAAIGASLGIVAFYAVGAFARSVEESQAEAEQLLVELEATRRAQADTAVLRERSRLARDVHDVLAHSLSGLMLQLEGARMLAGRLEDPGELPAVLDRAHHLARGGLEEARRAIGMLRDDDLPGPDRLAHLAAEFQRDSRIEASLEVAGIPRTLDPATRLTVYRVAQEALTNARRHGEPTRVELRLSYEARGTRLVVEDHAPPLGTGDRAGAHAGDGYGLTGMRERAELLGGRFDAGPTVDGFRVELWVPA